MSESRYPDWLPLINKRAAIKEQFPSFAKVAKERPGSNGDRAQREFHGARNLQSHAVSRRTARQLEQSHEDAEADADRFIAEQKAKEAQQTVARAAAWKHRNTSERKTA